MHGVFRAMSHVMLHADAGHSRSQASRGMHRLLGSSTCVLMLLMQLQAPESWACQSSSSLAKCAELLLIL